ncbi:hypothetical protein SCHPADRAFT_900440, partial [Schizopora paradoxa]
MEALLDRQQTQRNSFFGQLSHLPQMATRRETAKSKRRARLGGGVPTLPVLAI